MEVTLVTSNPGKFREVRTILRSFGVSVRHRAKVLPEMQADSLDVVVRAKLDGLARERGVLVVEDSGLFIPSLGGFPGVYSAYIYRIWGFDPILELLRHRGRSAAFRTVAAVRQGRAVRLFEGRVDGTIAARPRGSGGFGFDPIFVPLGKGRTFAELPVEEKNAISHRGRAFRKVGRYLTRGRHERG